jgi:hypothetical protein
VLGVSMPTKILFRPRSEQPTEAPLSIITSIEALWRYSCSICAVREAPDLGLLVRMM